MARTFLILFLSRKQTNPFHARSTVRTTNHECSETPTKVPCYVKGRLRLQNPLHAHRESCHNTTPNSAYFQHPLNQCRATLRRRRPAGDSVTQTKTRLHHALRHNRREHLLRKQSNSAKLSPRELIPQGLPREGRTNMRGLSLTKMRAKVRQ